MKPRCGRYAPSPTGPLHLGNLRTALLAWMQARLAGGRFILRMEDLDRPRVRRGSAENILADLRWLGLEWDEGPDCGGPAAPYNQSQREEFYLDALETLRGQGKIFPCRCSRKDIAEAASAPHGGRHSVYPGTCRNRGMGDDEKKFALRYKAPPRTVTFRDKIAGEQKQNLQREAGDFVVRRADGAFAYQLAVVVDDAMMGVTDVVRGADLLHATPRQLELHRALGRRPPEFWHVPLLHDQTGRRMAKRDGSDSLQQLRARGLGAEEVTGMLAAGLGWAKPGTALSAGELLGEFSGEGDFIRALRRCRWNRNG